MKTKTKKPTTAALAKLYKCNARTIRTWKLEKAPLHSTAKMRAWLAGRKNIPPGLTTAKPGQESCADDMQQGLGAAHALARLEGAEAAAHGKLQRALDSEEYPLAIKLARSSWLSLCESLRHFERSVSEDKRQRGELVNRHEVETGLRVLAYGTWLTHGETETTIVRAIQNEPDIIRARQLYRKAGWYSALAGLASGLACQVPKWMLNPFISDLSSNLSDGATIPQELEQFAAALREAGEAIGKQVVSETPATSTPSAPAV